MTRNPAKLKTFMPKRTSLVSTGLVLSSMALNLLAGEPGHSLVLPEV